MDTRNYEYNQTMYNINSVLLNLMLEKLYVFNIEQSDTVQTFTNNHALWDFSYRKSWKFDRRT